MPERQPPDPLSRTLPAVVISLDLELAWGGFDMVYGPRLLAQARWTHDVGVPLLLSLLSKNELSATWAVVGLVMEEQLPHVEHLEEVSYSHFRRPWFSFVPRGTSEAQAPEWFGASLVQKIRETSPCQELGFHSYSHVLFGHPGTSRVRAQQELASCRNLARALGFGGTAFVFPRNSMGYLDELKAAGFRCFRSPDHLPAGVPRFLGRGVAAVLSDILALAPRPVHPRIDRELVDIPGSLMVRYTGSWKRYIPDTCRAQRLRKGLKRVLEEGGVFHVWLHPENLYEGRPRIEKILAEFFDEVASMVRSGRVRCLTMGELANEVLGSR